nr:sulfotransferase domain-containing protein [Oceanococcus sp. HetDA_MAG_MS8]
MLTTAVFHSKALRASARLLRDIANPGRLVAHRHRRNQPIVLACYHKSGTELLSKIFAAVSRRFGWRFRTLHGYKTGLAPDAEVMLYAHSLIALDQVTEPYVGVHLIRDPRDIIVSGYLYHRQTQEGWCTNVPPSPPFPDDIDFPLVPYSQRHRDEAWKKSYLRTLAGLSYQQTLCQLSRDDGLIFEMDHYARWTIESMRDWNYTNEKVLEVRFEDLRDNFDQGFNRIFSHAGLRDDEQTVAMRIARKHDLNRKSTRELRRMTHVTGNEPQKWRRYFTPELKTAFLSRFGDILIDLGYEEDNRW